MNRYFHAIGFGIGLLAVIALSAINGAIMTDGVWLDSLIKPEVSKTAFTLGWLLSYVLTAYTLGEFVINSVLRKFFLLPVAFLLFTAISFFAFYRLNSPLLTLIFGGICIIIQGFFVFLTTKYTRLACVGVILNSMWYCYLFGIVAIICALN